ncbi:CRAL/TRIO domain-containing protein [Phthorimaea operculella]|nr:CRAL/TRIO domain-containing protein [Phthorimaea operculella]
MESLQKNEILEFQPDTLDAVRKIYNFSSRTEVDEAIDIFDTWVKQQNHFVKKDFSRDYLERMIINSKGSVERAKSRLDKLCTMRTLVPHFFADYIDVKKEFGHVAKDNCWYVPTAKLTDKHERVIMVKYAYKGSGTSKVLQDSFRLCALMCEYMKAYDYAASYMFVSDVRELNIADFMMKVSLTDLRNLMTIITDCFGFRLTGIHMLSNTKVLDSLVAFIKQVMSQKIGERIKVHSSLESVYKVAPKEVLPKEYGEGGETRSLQELHEKWMEALNSEDFKEYRKEMSTAVTDEKFRPTDTFNDQYMGMPGTFRNFKVD